jgi:hypothetical protein
LNTPYNGALPITDNDPKAEFYNGKIKELKFKLEKEKRIYKKLYQKRHQHDKKLGSEKIL